MHGTALALTRPQVGGEASHDGGQALVVGAVKLVALGPVEQMADAFAVIGLPALVGR